MARNGRLYEADTRNHRRRNKWLALVSAKNGAYTYAKGGASDSGSPLKTIEDLRRELRKLDRTFHRSAKHFR